MDDCAGDWASQITWTRRNGQDIPPGQQHPDDDGAVHIDHHGASTAFTGQHRPPQGPPHTLFSTGCNSLSGNSFHIVFRRQDNSSGPVEIFRYEGIGTVDPATGAATIRGRVKVFGGPPDPGDTATWDATRPPGGGDEDNKGKRDRGRRRGGSRKA